MLTLICRYKNNDVLVHMVLIILGGLVFRVGSKIKGHLPIVPIDAEPRPIILGAIDDCLEVEFAVPYVKDLIMHLRFFLLNNVIWSPQHFAAAKPSVPPTGRTSHGGDDASSSTNLSPSKVVRRRTKLTLHTG